MTEIYRRLEQAIRDAFTDDELSAPDVTRAAEAIYDRCDFDNLDTHIDILRRENAHLRTKMADDGCPYGHMKDGYCTLGYPGCACMDDLLAMMAWCPEDEEKANVRLGKRLKEAQELATKRGAQIVALRNDLTDYRKAYEDQVQLSEDGNVLLDEALAEVHRLRTALKQNAVVKPLIVRKWKAITSSFRRRRPIVMPDIATRKPKI